MSIPTDRIIVAMGGGGFSMEPDNPLLDDEILNLARAARGRQRPRICFIPTASGDSLAYIAEFYAAFARRSEADHLALFDRTVDDIERLPAPPGRHLRRRRQHREHARGLACPRGRPGAPVGVGIRAS